MTTISDGKGLIDCLNSDLPCDDRKTAMDIPVLEFLLKELDGVFRWAPHNKNPADASHMERLLKLLSTGHSTLRAAEDELEYRSKHRLDTGRTVRLKSSALVHTNSKRAPK